MRVFPGLVAGVCACYGDLNAELSTNIGLDRGSSRPDVFREVGGAHTPRQACADC